MQCSTAFRPGLTPVTVGLMVLGFLIAWPLGLAMLAWIVWGHRLVGFADGVRTGLRDAGWSVPGRWTAAAERAPFAGGSGNMAFDEYRRREMERLDAERRRLDEERRAFEQHVRDLQRARDQEEFDRFMAERRRTAGPTAG